jgi:hypothetical protein
MSWVIFCCLVTLSLWIIIEANSKEINRGLITADALLILIGVLGIYFHWVD